MATFMAADREQKKVNSFNQNYHSLTLYVRILELARYVRIKEHYHYVYV